MMRKLIIFIALSMMAIVAIAQERTIETIVLDRSETGTNYSYYKYTGDPVLDVLIPTTRDTVDLPYDLRKNKGYNYTIVNSFSPRSTADTSVTVLVLGRNSTAEEWTTLSTNVSSPVIANNIVQTIKSSSTVTIAPYNSVVPAFTVKQDTTGFKDYPADSLKFPSVTVVNAAQTLTFSLKTEYRLIMIRFILTGNDHTGNGVKLNSSELKLWL